MPGQLFWEFYIPFQEHARSPILRILQTVYHGMPGQHASFFEEKYYKKTTSMPGQLFSEIYKPNPRACQVSYFHKFTNQIPEHARSAIFRILRTKSNAMSGQLFSEFYEPNPMPCQVSMSAFSKKSVKKKITSMPGQLVSKFYKPNPKACQVSYFTNRLPRHARSAWQLFQGK